MLHIRLVNALSSRLFRLCFASRFGRFGKRSLIVAPVAIEGPGRIYLGDDVYVAAQTCLAAMPHTGIDTCRLEIGDGCRIGRFNHIYATSRVTLGAKVLTANGVYIADNSHGFQDPVIAILDQPIEQSREVTIGEGSWLGHNVCIVGANVGRHCVIGANAVVTRDIPDFCVALGVPAVVIRRYDAAMLEWRPTNPAGDFLDGAKVPAP